MRIRAVLFDAAGTLIELEQPVGESYAKFAHSEGVQLPAWRLQDAFERILRAAPPRVFPGSVHSQIPKLEREWWRTRVLETFRAADSTVRFENFEAFFDRLYQHFGTAAAWGLRAGVREALSGLRAAGIRLGIGSNFDHRLPDILEALEIRSFFSSVTLPAGCGFAKPDAPFFAAALADLGAEPDRTLYLGDEPEAQLGRARAIGLAAASIHKVENLAELPAHLQAIATLDGNRGA